jgi:hypothetical protein
MRQGQGAADVARARLEEAGARGGGFEVEGQMHVRALDTPGLQQGASANIQRGRRGRAHASSISTS